MSIFAKGTVPPIINTVSASTQAKRESFSSFTIATRNQGKIAEYARILGKAIEGVDLKVPEIQHEDPLVVLEHKAKEAWRLNDGQPIIVEDSILQCVALENLPGTFADAFTNSVYKRTQLCKMLDGLDRTTIFQVTIGVYDGYEFQYRIGRVAGTLAEKPKGTDGFGFDDIFIPDRKKKEKKTFAELSAKEKDFYSPRRISLEALAKKPFELRNRHVFMLPEPFKIQMQALRLGELKENSKALKFAYHLEQFADNQPEPNFEAKKRLPYKEIPLAKGEIKQFVSDEKSASIGLLLTPWDKAKDLYGKPKHVKVNDFDQPTFWQMGDQATKVALAARAYEFNLQHSESMYAHIRALMSGEIPMVKRANKPSPVVDELLKIHRKASGNAELTQILGTAATRELGYSRMSSNDYMSRTLSANKGLLLMTTGIPSSLFSLGGMPPVTGWRDVIVAAALSYMRSYIPRNSVFAGDLERQLRLFTQARTSIESLNLPKDIENIVIRQIGIAVGVEKPKEIAKTVAAMKKRGCKSVRIYTTNPDPRIIETALAIRQAAGKDMLICVGPIVDVKQARKLIEKDIAVNILLAGHGGGENCTSLAGGGTANSLELLYEMYLDPVFNNTAIGLEGGTGDEIGALLGLLDVISLNRRGVAGGIETGGLFVEHVKGKAVQPYHGSASIVTQWIESAMSSEIAGKRLNAAGRLKNVEGVLNYITKHQSTHSIVEHFWERRMFAGRALADQDAKSIYDLRANIHKVGHENHRVVTNEAAFIASAHRIE